jgi:hypothetical protein
LEFSQWYSSSAAKSLHSLSHNNKTRPQTPPHYSVYNLGGALSFFESSSDVANAFDNNDNHPRHGGINEEEGEEEGQEHFIIEQNNNEHHEREHNDLFSKGSKYDNEEDEENPPHVPTGNPATLIEEDQELLLVEGGGGSNNVFQLALFQRDVMEAKSTAAKAMKIAIEAKKETKETIKVLEATKEELSGLTARLENNFSHHNDNNRGEENNCNSNNNAPQFRKIDTSLIDNQSQTASLSADTYTLMPVTGISVLVQLVKVQLKVELLFSAKIMWLGMILGHLRLENGGCI